MVFGAMALAALWLFASALAVQPYHDTADGMKQKAADLLARIERAQPPESMLDLPPRRDLAGRLRHSFVTVDPALFPISPMSQPYSEQKVRRTQPELLAAEDLKTYAGFGAIAMSESDLGRDRFVAGRNAGNETPGDYAVARTRAVNVPANMPRDPGGVLENAEPPMVAAAPPAGQRARPTRGRRARGRRPPANVPKPRADKTVRPKSTPFHEPLKPALAVPAGTKLQGRYWVSVVGLIPVANQSAEFHRVFRDVTKTYPTDIPDYLYCDVERAEVGAAGEIGEFKLLDMERAADDMAYWAAVYPELVDADYLLPSVDVTSPLPPLVLANHAPNAVRHPKIPLAEETRAKEQQLAAAAAAAEIKQATAPVSRRRKPASHRRGAQTAPPGMPGSIAPPTAKRVPERQSVKKENIQNRLFRFFDFDVTPGKRYAYRVRLALYNPNFEVPVRYLADDKLAESPELFTPWSEPTAAIFVPPGTELLAGNVDPAEPKAKVMVRQFDAETAITAVHVFNMSRGATANAPGIEVALPKFAPRSAGQNSLNVQIDFRSGATLVDLIGGEKLSAGLSGGKAPGRVLIITADGELALLSQSADAARFESEMARLQAAAPRSVLMQARE